VILREKIMSEDELNNKFIRKKLEGICQDCMYLEKIETIFDNLEKENEKLKAELEMYENGVIYSSEADNLQNKIDKAIEYIETELKEINKHQYATGTRRLNKILQILEGSDE
jgi:exonuclease VII small subunit